MISETVSAARYDPPSTTWAQSRNTIDLAKNGDHRLGLALLEIVHELKYGSGSINLRLIIYFAPRRAPHTMTAIDMTMNAAAMGLVNRKKGSLPVAENA